MKKKIILVILLIILALVCIQFYPALSLKSTGMITEETDHFILYYEPDDKEAAQEIGEILEQKRAEINAKLNYHQEEKTEVYIYPDQNTFHGKKYGMAGRIFGPDWYIGDNVGEKVLLVSPNNPGSHHSYDSVVVTAVHEYVHTVVYAVNPQVSKWLNEGLAVYLAEQAPDLETISVVGAPSYQDTQTSNPVKFGKMSGYAYSYTYLQFLDRTFGMDAVSTLLKENPADYENVFSYTEEEIYEMWLDYLEGYRMY
ncbi:hypothetical protein SAMN05421736_101767 [Evansella caseinilytica]|uniref:Basic secretory peptidase family protein n=1 Tax=Evansella caseinilytica TaxID=1503961 RepID=A0A1H3IAF5_9BACI|nr:hypothetical protein [Evansella caseinilytica]SDY24733.1 hypothetical protein SAMN05421736_101767 [Evansella caseinilytica]